MTMPTPTATTATSTDTMAHIATAGIGLSKPGDWPEDAAHENGREIAQESVELDAEIAAREAARWSPQP